MDVWKLGNLCVMGGLVGNNLVCWKGIPHNRIFVVAFLGTTIHEKDAMENVTFITCHMVFAPCDDNPKEH
jgi:hypothetical protein